MTSKLASLLVQEGLVSPKKMAEAFQRQVIYGGTLDTILLEMEILDEASLISALGRAAGFPTTAELPSRAELESAGVLGWFAQGVAEKYRAVPVGVDGNVVRVLVTDPPDRKQLDELGYTLGRSIDVAIVPEHRFHNALGLVYGATVPARFSSLAARLRQRFEETPTREVQQIMVPAVELSPAQPAAKLTAARLAREAETTPAASLTPTPAPVATALAPTATTLRDMPAVAASALTAPSLPASSVPRSTVPLIKAPVAPPPPDETPTIETRIIVEPPPSKLSGTPGRGQRVSGARSVVSDVPMSAAVEASAAASATPPTPMPMPAQPNVPSLLPAQGEEPTPRLTTREANAPQVQISQGNVTQAVTAPQFLDPDPLPVAAAVAAIDAASDRDAILEALCRGARSKVGFVALFMVHGNAAVGRIALADHWLPRDVLGGLTIALDQPSAFRTAAQGRSPYLGRLGDEGSGPTVLALGRKPPLPALILPLILKDRAVALLYGDDAGRAIDGATLAELNTLSAAAARAFQRLIMKQKGAAFTSAAPASSAKPAAKLDLAGDTATSKPSSRSVAALASASTRKIEAPRPSPSEWKPAEPAPAGKPVEPATPVPASVMEGAMPTAPASDADSDVVVEASLELEADYALPRAGRDSGRRHTVLGFSPLGREATPTGPTPSRGAGPAMTDAEALVFSVLREDEHATRSAEALMLLGDRGADVAVAHMPGPLRLDRHSLRGPIPPLHEHGPLLAVIARFGAAALRPLTARLADPSLEVRFYATVALGNLRQAAAVPALGLRLWDADPGVRRAAAAALARFEVGPELRTLTEALRGELPGPDVQRQRHSAEALGIMRDVPSVPRLIELLKHPDAQLVELARTALIDITKQDFGTSRWRWRTWWERHRHEPRLEWVLEGLAHAEAEVRQKAADELRAMSLAAGGEGAGDMFGYHPDQPKREREDARRRWVEHWRKKS